MGIQVIFSSSSWSAMFPPELYNFIDNDKNNIWTQNLRFGLQTYIHLAVIFALTFKQFCKVLHADRY